MDEEKIRTMIREELANVYGVNFGVDKTRFEKKLQILDARNIQVGRTTGTKIGTATDQKLGFYGTTPVDKPATVTDANAQGALYSQSDAQSIATAVNAVIDRLQELGLIA